MTTATFTYDLSSVEVSFDVDTNMRSPGGTTGSFACNSLFMFDMVNISTCSWQSPSVVSIGFDHESVLGNILYFPTSPVECLIKTLPCL